MLFVDFAIPPGMKMKESEKRDIYLNLARELKKLWSMKVIVILVVVGALEMVPQGLEMVPQKNWKSKEESRPSKLQHC